MPTNAPLTQSRGTQAGVPVIGSLFTGYGGLDLATKAALGGGRIAWVADADRHVRTVLATRTPEAPNLGDVATIHWQNVEPVDVITAGWPCQDISSAGKRAGIDHGTRSGLWRHVATAVRTLRHDLSPPRTRLPARISHHDPTRAIALARASAAQPSTSAASEPSAVGDGDGQPRPTDTHHIHWGVFESAIRRWESMLARPAPHSVEPGRAGRPVLSAKFVEWLMGLDEGYLTSLNLPRTALLRILGNGVVPQQATHALRSLLIQLATTEPDHDEPQELTTHD